jgi:hypothetical protein
MNLLDTFSISGWRLRNFAAKEQVRMTGLAAASRVRDNELRGQFYAAATPGINRPMAPNLSTPEDYRQAYQRIIMIRYGRQLEDDIPYVESILSDFETYVVGDLRYRPNTGNASADKVIQEHLEWRFANCDLAAQLDLTGIAKLAVRSKKRDGECGFVYVDDGDTIKLQAIEGDCIGNPLLTSSGAPTNYNGIIVDLATGAPVQFDLWRRLPKLNAYVFDRTVSVNDFIHFYDPFRYSQKHGITAFKNAITRAVDIEQIVQFAIQNIKFRSSQVPAIQNEQGKPKAPGSGYVPQQINSNGVPQPYQIAIDGVNQNFLKIGEGYVEYPHDFPNANFVDIKDDLKGDIAISVHLPGEFCFRSQAGGVLQRFYIEKAQRTFDEEKRLLKRSVLNPYKNRVLVKDVDSGLLNLDAFPGLAGSRALLRGTWHMGRSVSTDYGHDTDSDIKLIDANLMSAEEYLGDNARDSLEIRETKRKRVIELFQDAKQISDIVNRPLAEVLPYIQKLFPNPILVERASDTNAGVVADDGSGDTIPPPTAEELAAQAKARAI